MRSQLWQRLRAARGAADLKQGDIAEACGVSRVAVGHWESSESGRRTRPSIDSLKIISDLTGAPLDWLMDDEADIHPKWVGGTEEVALPKDIIPVPALKTGKCEVAGMLHDNPGMSADEACDAVGVEPVAHVYISNDMSSNVGATHEARLFMFFCEDDAMEPEIRKDDGVIVDVDAGPNGPSIANGDLIALRSFDSPARYVVRRLQVLEYSGAEATFQLVPENQKAATLKFETTQLKDDDLYKTIRAMGFGLTFSKVIQVRRVYF